MRQWQEHLDPKPAQRTARHGLRPILVGLVGSLAVLTSWGIEFLASSNSASAVPASLTPPSVPAPASREPMPKDPPPRSDPSASSVESQAKPPLAKDNRQESPPEGPALGVPREVVSMLDQRKRDLDRREESVKNAEDRLTMLKAELEQILTRYEKLVDASNKRRKDAKDKLDKTAMDKKVKQEQEATELRNQHQAQLAKMFESMPSEEAAARLEKMPDRKAIEVLRLLKGKTAGAILATIKPERAAKLTEQLLATP